MTTNTKDRFRRLPLWGALALLALGSCASMPQWVPYGDVETLALEEWLGDLDTLEAEVGRHPRVWNEPVIASAFASSVRELRESLQDASGAGLPLDALAVAGMARALGTVGDGHTGLNAYPTELFVAGLRWFPAPSGGWELRLTVADERNATWLGGRVVAVRPPEGADIPVGDGGVPVPGTVHGIVSSVLSIEDALDQDLRAFACRSKGPAVLTDPLLARGVGLAGESLALVFDAQTLPAGTSAVLSLQPQGAGTRAHILDSAPRTPLSRKSSDPWWYERDESGILYLQYNQCDWEAVALLGEVAALVEAGEVGTLVVDLRWNGGGNSIPGKRFVSRIAATALGQEPGRLYVLVGPQTFSSAMMNAVDFKVSTRAILAGLPLIEPTSHYGEVVRFELPASGLVVGRSSRFFRDYGGIAGELPRGVIEPDSGWSMEPTFEEYRLGQDPVLEAVLAAAAR